MRATGGARVDECGRLAGLIFESDGAWEVEVVLDVDVLVRALLEVRQAAIELAVAETGALRRV